MRIFNQDKTAEVKYPNLSLGYLRNDRLLTTHHDAVERKIIRTAREIAEEYNSQGKQVNLRSDGNWYVVTAVYNNGGITEERIEDVIQEAKEAYDEYEDIQVYVPYTQEQLLDIKRSRRKSLLSAFDKWEKAVLRGREQDDYIVMEWYHSLLDLDDIAFENLPDRIKYYL